MLSLDWVRRQRATVPLMTSVCTGVTGLCGGGRRFVVDGDIINAAGISAGIDMALHLVARLCAVERAREVWRGIQYDPVRRSRQPPPPTCRSACQRPNPAARLWLPSDTGREARRQHVPAGSRPR
jgi:transcriptional regulator GlxA family with amidase domain